MQYSAEQLQWSTILYYRIWSGHNVASIYRDFPMPQHNLLGQYILSEVALSNFPDVFGELYQPILIESPTSKVSQYFL